MKGTQRSTSMGNARSAYTLIELLLAMMLSTVVLAALWSLLNIYTRLFDTAGVETEQAQLARAMLVMIETDLINIVPEAQPRETSAGTNPDETDAPQDSDTPTPGDVIGPTPAPDTTDSAATANTEKADQLPASTTSGATEATDTGSFSSHLSNGTMSDDSQHATFAQPSLLGTSETLWLVVHRHGDTSDPLNPQPLVRADTTFQPAAELAIVQYALTYQDAADALGTTSNTPSMPFETDDAAESSRLTETSSAEGLDDWQAIANSEMETAAAQLGLIDRELIDASRGIERREAFWPVSPLASSLPSASFDPTLLDQSSGNDEGFALRREFKPPSRVADIHGRVSDTPSTSFGSGSSPAEEVKFESLLTPEVVRVRFRYHDGNAWRSQWDSRAQGALPRAVEIILAVLPTDDVAVQRELEHFEESQSSGEGPWPVYRHVVALPTAARHRAHQREEPNFEVTPSASDATETISPGVGGLNE